MSERNRPPRSSEPYDDRLWFETLKPDGHATLEHFQDFRTTRMPEVRKAAATPCFINLLHGLNLAVESKRRHPWELGLRGPELRDGKNRLGIVVVQRSAVQLPPMVPRGYRVEEMNPYYYQWNSEHPFEAGMALDVPSLVAWSAEANEADLSTLGLGGQTGDLLRGFIAAVQEKLSSPETSA